MQRKVHSKNKPNDEYIKVNGRMINTIFTTFFIRRTYLLMVKFEILGINAPGDTASV